MTARGRTGPVPAAVTSGVFAIYFLVEAFEPYSTFRLVLGIATAALTERLVLRGTLVAGKGGIKWHTVMRTWRWSYSEVDHFEFAVRTRASGPALRVVRIHLTDGRAHWLGALEEVPPQDSGASDWYSRISDWIGALGHQKTPATLEESVVQLNRILATASPDRRERRSYRPPRRAPSA